MWKKKRNLVMCLVFSVSLLVIAFSAYGAEYPERPITWIHNWSPGGGSDLASRALAKAAGTTLGQPIVVINKLGASGALGVSAIAAARPDGYTIGSVSYVPVTLLPQLQDVPYDPLNDFDYICCYGAWRYGPVVRSDSPFRTLKDLVEYGKANPGKIKYGSMGPATINTLGMVYLAKAEGIKWDGVHFRGTAEAVAALLGGHVGVIPVASSEAVSHIKAGRMRVLASFSDKRWEEIPNVPTVKELGYDFKIVSYLGLGAPKGVPKPIIDKLRGAFRNAMSNPEFLQIMKMISIVPDFYTGDEYKRIVEEGYNLYKDTMLEMGLHKSQKK